MHRSADGERRVELGEDYSRLADVGCGYIGWGLWEIDYKEIILDGAFTLEQLEELVALWKQKVAA